MTVYCILWMTVDGERREKRERVAHAGGGFFQQPRSVVCTRLRSTATYAVLLIIRIKFSSVVGVDPSLGL